GWIVAVPSLVGIFAMITGSYFADRVEDKRPMLSALLIVCAIGWIGRGLYAPSAWALLAVTLVEIGIGIARPMFWTVPPLFLSGAGDGGGHRADQCLRHFRRDHRSRCDRLDQDHDEQLLRRAVLCRLLRVRFGDRHRPAAHRAARGESAQDGPLSRHVRPRRAVASASWAAPGP